MATGESLFNKEADSLNEKFSFDILDKLGYSKKHCEKRVQMYRTISKCITKIHKGFINYNAIIAGSRGEGICISCDSDADMLMVKKMALCIEHPETLLNSDKNISVLFQLDFENVPCGYAQPRLVSLDEDCHDFGFLPKIKENLVQRNDQKYLKNDKSLISVIDHNRTGVVNQPSIFDEITGPARTLRCEVPMIPKLHISADCVPALRCKYPSVIDDWCQRKRKHSWPDMNLIETVKRLDVLVVPAGCKESPDEELQWRISLTLAEQALTHSFNDIQIKLFVALKLLTKQELKPVCENITSYIVKNLIFWTFENNEIKSLTKDNFDDTLVQILENMKMCITWKYLPSYMIPSKNMLQYKIFEKEKVDLLRRINVIIQDRHSMLLSCPFVKEMSLLSTDEIEEINVFKDLLQQGALAVFLVTASQPELADEIWNDHRNPTNVLLTVITKVFPLSRRYNQMGLLDRLSSISVESFISCLVTGILRGYHKK